ncbi:MAG: hypothetical protein JXR19_07225 [Bacteroidia bacterium]
MSEENKNSNLDQFFRSRLSKEDNSSWNNPSDEVFDKAMAVVNAKKKRRFAWWWFALIGLLALSSAYLFWSQQEINLLTEQVGELNELLESKELINNSEIQNTNDGNEVTAENGESIAVEEVKNVSNRNSNAIAKETPTRTKAYREIPIIENTPEENDIVLEMIPESDEAYESPPAPEVLPEGTEPPEIPNEKVITIKDTIATLPYTYPSLDVIPLKPHSAWFAFGGMNWTSLSMSAANPLPNNLTRYDNWYNGHQYGFGYKRQIKSSSFKIHTQLSYTLARNNSLFRNEPMYDAGNEVNTNGDIVYRAVHVFESPIGGYSQDIVFDPDGMNQGDLMKSSMEVSNEFKIWGLHLGASYNLYQKGLWHIAANSALGINYISEMQQDFNFNLIGPERVLDRFSGSVSELASLNQVYPSASIGADVSRDIGPISLGVSTGYQRSLSSIRSVDPVSKVKTQMSTLQTSIKISWNLN